MIQLGRYQSLVNCGSHHSIFITGENRYLFLGLRIKKPKEVQTFFKIKNSHSQSNFSTLLSTNGELYYLGEIDSFSFKNLESEENPIRFQVFKKYHVLKVRGFSTLFVFTLNNGVLALGENNYGRMGVNIINHKKDNEPVKISIKSEFIDDIQAGEDHTLAITTSNKLFSCGANYFGQNCHKNRQNVFKEVEVCHGIVHQISCGYGHNLILTKKGRVFSNGWNTDGALGLNNFNDVKEPELITSLEHVNIIKVKCSWYSSVFFSNGGDIYVAGLNVYGELPGRPEKTAIPTKINIHNRKIIDYHGGWKFSVFITESGEIFTSGANSQRECGRSTKEKIEVGLLSTKIRVFFKKVWRFSKKIEK